MFDTRAPVEFEKGSFPNAINLPLMLDDERAKVGTCYKQQGQEAAIELGHKLVCGDIKDERVAKWKAFCEANPEGYLFCFRGGMRSQITQQWIKDAGIDYPYVVGGYKAMRRFLIDTLDDMANNRKMFVVGGNTGNGKTIMVREIPNGLDLEGAAHHRGSSFGRFVTPQRGQIDFENALAINALKLDETDCQTIVTEDEGRIIGSANVPLSVYNAMQTAPIAVIEDPFEVRLQRLIDEYVILMHNQHTAHEGEEEGWNGFCDYLHQGLFRCRKRLGAERYQEIEDALTIALDEHLRTGDTHAHECWLSPLLEHYYDPMYTYQLSKKADRIVFRGNYEEVKAFLAEQ